MTTVAAELSGIGQMVARHAFGSKVIVASRAREACKRGNRSVIKLNGWKKRTRAVAGTATHAGWNMVRRFAAHMETIVATLASAFLDHDMTEHQPRKAGRSRCMTTVTGSANRYVLDRSGQSASRIVLNVAGSTLSGITLDGPVHATSTVEADTEVTAGPCSIALTSHIHSKVTSGSDNSGPPVP